MLWVPLLLLIVATAFDLARRQIPDLIALGLVGWAIIATALGLSPQGWLSLALGLGLGFALGMFLFWLGAFGGGDAKVMAALGATLGWQQFPPLLFYVAVAGGLMAVVALVRGKRDLAYAPALTLGWAAFMVAHGTW